MESGQPSANGLATESQPNQLKLKIGPYLTQDHDGRTFLNIAPGDLSCTQYELTNAQLRRLALESTTLVLKG